MFQNLLYIPIQGTQKYMSATISGSILSTEQFTLDEIKLNHPTSFDKREECKDFHDMCKQWGNKD